MDEAPQHENSVSDGDRVVVFEVGEYVCALPLERIREVIPMCALAQPPGLPPVLEGFLNLRGEITPVIRTDRLFSLPPIVFHRHTQLVVLRGDSPLALLSNRVRSVTAVASSDLLPPPRDSVFNHCLAGVLSLAQDAIHLLHVERLLLTQEKQRIAELRRIAESRLAELEGAQP